MATEKQTLPDGAAESSLVEAKNKVWIFST